MSYIYHGRSPTSRTQFPIIVTKAKHILPPKRTSSTSSSRRAGLSKSKSSRLSNIAILSQMNGHHNYHHHLKSNSSSPVDGKGQLNGSPTSEVYGSVNRNGSSASYGSSYRGSDKMYTRNKATYKTNLNEEINRMYIEEGLKSGLLEKTKIKKPDGTGNGINGVGGYSETDGASDGTGRSNGKLIKGKSSSSKSKSKSQSKGKKRTVKELQTFIMRRILLCTNIVSLLIGIASLVAAGILDPQPLHRIGTTGGQVSLASIYIIFVSLVGLYGSRLKNYRLLFIYAYTLLTGLVLRSFAALLSVYIYHNANRLIFSMLFAIIEVILIFMGLAVAIDLKEEHLRKLFQQSSTNTFKV